MWVKCPKNLLAFHNRQKLQLATFHSSTVYCIFVLVLFIVSGNLAYKSVALACYERLVVWFAGVFQFDDESLPDEPSPET